jgi:myosin heavy subunit
MAATCRTPLIRRNLVLLEESMSTAAADLPDTMTTLPETIECPLCIGKGSLTRTEVLERLGMKDFARVAQLSAEEAIRILLKNEKESEQARWAKFEVELTKRLAEVNDKHNAELQKLQTEKNEVSVRLKEFEKNSATVVSNAKQQERLTTEKELQKQLNTLTGRIADLEATQKLAEQQKATEVAKAKAELEAALNTEKAKANDLDRRVKDYLGEVEKLRGRNEELQAEMAKVARVGKKEEIDFAEDVRSWSGIWISDKLTRRGDYLLAFRDGAGNALDPKMVVDNKDKASVTEPDVKKLIRDCREHKLMVGVIVTREETQLRSSDRECRWGQEDGIWLLRSTRGWLQRDLEVLKPVFERMRVEGADFLQKNAALADEVRRTFVDLDEIDKELRKAGTAIDKAKMATANYHTRLSGLCDGASQGKKPPAASGGEFGTSAATGD